MKDAQMWSTKHDKCIKCDKDDSPHASKGVCQRCYQGEYQREHYFKLHGHYPVPKIKHIKEVKQIKHKARLIEYGVKWREFISHIPSDAKNFVESRMMKLEEERPSWCFRYDVYPELRDRNFCMIYLYLVQGMSQYEIKQKFNDLFINVRGRPITGNSIQRVVCKYRALRRDDDAVRLRVIRGRMDYNKRNIDYGKRKIDYVMREQKKRAGALPKHKCIVIRADDDLKMQVVALSQEYKKTLSDTLKILLDSVTDLQLPQTNFTYADKLKYAIEHNINNLAKTELRDRRKESYIITGRDNK